MYNQSRVITFYFKLMQNEPGFPKQLLFMIIILVIAAVGALSFAFYSRSGSTLGDKVADVEGIFLKEDQELIENTIPDRIKFEVTGNEESKNYYLDWEKGMSVYGLLLEAETKFSDFEVGFETYEFSGVQKHFVTELNGISPDPSQQFWKFRINGEDASIGIDDYKPEPGDSLGFILDDVEG